jgi:hypothetical protein
MIVKSTPIQTMYYNKGDLMTQAAPVDNYDNFSQGMSNLNFGSSTSFLIPQSYQGFSDMMLDMVFPAPGVGTFLTVPLGFAAISRIDINIGTAVIYTIQGRALMLKSISECETDSKINQIMSLANGGQSLGTLITGATGNIECIIPLSILFSSIYALKTKKPIALDLTNSPMNMTVYLNSQYYFSSGTAYAFSLVSGQLLGRTHQFINREDSLRDELMSNKSYSYMYPSIFIQEITLPSQLVSNLTSTPTITNYSNFRKSPVLGVWMSFVADADDVAPAINHFRLTPLQNIRVDRDGTVLYLAPGNSYLMKSLFNLTTQFQFSAYSQTNIPVPIIFSSSGWWMNGDSNIEVMTGDGIPLQGSTLNIQYSVNASAPVQGKIVLHVLYNGSVDFYDGLANLNY